MSYTHVIVKMKSAGKNAPITHVETDLDEQFVLDRIIKPYVNKSDLFVDGSAMSPNEIEKISVFQSDADGKTLLNEAESRLNALVERMASQNVFMGGESATMQTALVDGATEITRKMFNQAQGF